PAGKEGVWRDEQRVSPFARERGKSRVDLADRAGLDHMHLPLHGARSRLRVSRHCRRTPRIARIDEHAKASCSGYQLTQNAHAPCHQFGDQKIDTGYVATRPGNIGDKTERHRVFGDTEDNRYCRGCRLGGDCARLAHDDHHADLTTHQIGYEFWKAIEPAFRPAIFDGDVATFDIAGLRQSLAQGGKAAAHRIAGRRGAEIADDWHRWLLRACRERPSCRGERPRSSAAEESYELAAFHR